MRIIEKIEMSRTIYYAVEAEVERKGKDDLFIEATLTAYWNDDNAVPSYDLTIMESNDSKKLTDKEVEKLEELVIDFNN